MRKVVLDTNVLVSAFWSGQGNPYRILEMFFEGEIALHYNDEIIEEYNEVLHRDKLGFSEEKVHSLIAEIAINGIFVTAPKSSISFIDEDDRKYYDTAKASGAVVVTGNKKHYPNEPIILTPAEFLESIES
jgi:putative PIN family toxin of toxin-antitoxin system